MASSRYIDFITEMGHMMEATFREGVILGMEIADEMENGSGTTTEEYEQRIKQELDRWLNIKNFISLEKEDN